MIAEDEAFWAGIAVATLMLGGGFSMLFLPTFTGFGSIVLALGLMTMALTIQLRAKPMEQIEAMAPLDSQILTPTLPIEPQVSEYEATTEEPVSAQSQAASEEHVEPEPLVPVELPETEPRTVAATPTPPTEEKPKEHPQVTAPAT